MSDQTLLVTLKALNYSNAEIKAIMAAADSAKIESLSAHDMTQLATPLQAAAQSSRHAAQLRQIDSAIFHASGCKWRLPKDTPVNVHDVDRHIRNASIETRMAIKSGLRSLNLIAA